MPPLEAGEYLIELLFEIGPVKHTGMGAVGIDEADIMAWQLNQDLRLQPWEARTLRVLSREYASMLVDASSPSCPPPFVPKADLSVEQRENIADAMSSWADKFNSAKGFN